MPWRALGSADPGSSAPLAAWFPGRAGVLVSDDVKEAILPSNANLRGSRGPVCAAPRGAGHGAPCSLPRSAEMGVQGWPRLRGRPLFTWLLCLGSRPSCFFKSWLLSMGSAWARCKARAGRCLLPVSSQDPSDIPDTPQQVTFRNLKMRDLSAERGRSALRTGPPAEAPGGTRGVRPAPLGLSGITGGRGGGGDRPGSGDGARGRQHRAARRRPYTGFSEEACFLSII